MELAAGDFQIVNSKEEVRKRSRTNTPRLLIISNRGLLMGGYFSGRPMEPKSGPAKTKKAKPGYTSSNMGWRRNKPASPLRDSRKERTR